MGAAQVDPGGRFYPIRDKAGTAAKRRMVESGFRLAVSLEELIE